MNSRLVAGAAALAWSAAAALSAQVPAGGEFQVNTYTTSGQYGDSVALAPDGRFVVAWDSLRQDGSSFGVFARAFAATGAPAGDELAVNVVTSSTQSLADVAFAPDGSFVVAFNGPGTDGYFDVITRGFDRAGTPRGGEFRVNTHSAGNQYRPAVAALPGHRGYVVSWTESEPGVGRVMARRVARSGAPIGADFQVSIGSNVGQVFADTASSPSGAFVVVWYGAAPGFQVVGRLFDPAGLPVGAQFTVARPVSVYFPFPFPKVAMAGDGSFVVVWQDETGDGSGYGVRGRRFSPAAVPLGDEFVVNATTLGNQAEPHVAMDETGGFVVAWSSDPQFSSEFDALARRFDAQGRPRGAEFLVNTYTTGGQGGTPVGGDGAGNFVVAWSAAGQDGSGRGVFAQRFGGLLPAALVVDPAAGPTSDGNTVLDPGETVAVRPAWRNVNGAAQAFTGALSNAQGPAGATYTITDAAGAYGTVANGATGACTDCYAVGVSAPATRPAAHWDATVDEGLAPDALGQSKRWRLHVGESFADVPRTNGFYRFVETLLHAGVTAGCGGGAYCPAAGTERQQMAVFVLVALEGAGYAPPACGTPAFPDVPAASPFCPFVEELARRGVVAGCGNGNYCPADLVTREQMAVFVLRTLDGTLTPPACTTPLFNDVPAGSVYCRWIEELARRGVVSGCGGGNYCPSDPVTREQMAVFIAGTFGLSLYGPLP